MHKNMTPFAGDQESLRQANLSRILIHLSQNAPTSRAVLAEMSGLNRATVTRLMRELIEHGLVQEIGLLTAREGHPSILLELDPEAGYMIGAEIELKFSSVVLTNLAAAIVWRQEVLHNEGEAWETVWKNVIGLIQQAIEKAGECNQCILGLGMSLPGLVNGGEGVLLFTPSTTWKNLPVRQWLLEKFHFPIHVDNKANMGALCESYFGAARSGEYVLYIHLSDDVGAGIVVGQWIVAGAAGLAGNVGHMSIDPDGLLCACGNSGCWEMYVSAPAVFQRVRQGIQAGTSTRLYEYGQDNCDQLTIPIIVEAARHGDQVALAALQETAVFLGNGIMNLINILNPDKVVLGGYFCQAHEFMLPVVQEIVHKRTLGWSGEVAEIVVAKHQEDAGLLGAVARVYSQILLDPVDSFKAILHKGSPALEREDAKNEL
jgi:N-acetylglucosamine repressor